MRHRIKKKKLGRTAAHRKSLLRNLTKSLIEYGFVTTTEAKAKYLKPYLEGLMSFAKKGDLSSRRILISRLGSKESAARLIENIAPQYKAKVGGYVRIIKMGSRKGDNALLSRVEWIRSEPASDKKNEVKKERKDRAPKDKRGKK